MLISVLLPIIWKKLIKIFLFIGIGSFQTREAIINAIVHRDYDIDGAPIYFEIGCKAAQRHLAAMKKLRLIHDNGEDANSPNYKYVVEESVPPKRA